MLFPRLNFPRQLYPPRRSRGFSLVEIMVGMVIGMLGIIVMMQIFALAEGQKRATTGGGDAQNNGAIALYGVQRDIRQAGWGNSDLKVIGCDVLLPTTRSAAAPPAVTLNPLAPVTINHPGIPAGDANTDTLLVAYGNTNGTPQGDGFVAANATANIFQVQTPTSFIVNDWVIAIARNRPAQPASCGTILDQVNCIGIACAAAVPSAANIVVATGAVVNTLLGGVPSATLYNLGQAPKILAYAIRNGNLTLCDYMANDCAAAGNVGNSAIWVPIGSNIVSMRAQYGRDTTVLPAPATVTMDGIVDIYDQTSPALQTTNNVAPTPTTGCGWARISAIRLVLVARSGQYEKTQVTAAAPAWLGTAATPIDLSGYADWQNYRYKIFQTVVPIRNIAWLGAQTGC